METDDASASPLDAGYPAARRGGVWLLEIRDACTANWDDLHSTGAKKSRSAGKPCEFFLIRVTAELKHRENKNSSRATVSTLLDASLPDLGA